MKKEHENTSPNDVKRDHKETIPNHICNHTCTIAPESGRGSQEIGRNPSHLPTRDSQIRVPGDVCNTRVRHGLLGQPKAVVGSVLMRNDVDDNAVLHLERVLDI